MIPGEPLLSPALLVRAIRLRSTGPIAKEPLFAYARHALARCLEERRVTSSVLYVPAYICTEATLPLQHIGQQVRYYPVREDLEPDWVWLEGNVDRLGGALLLVHYFGFPNAIGAALDFSAEHGLLLIEDCAHSFLTCHGHRVIGSIGDAGIYSYRKLLPLPNGAGLIMKGQDGSSGWMGDANERGNNPYWNIARQLVKHGLYRSGIPTKLLGRLATGPPHSNGTFHEGGGRQYPAIADISWRIMKVLEPDFDRIVSVRRKHYQHLADAFRQFPEVTLLYPSLLEGVCPYLFPILLHQGLHPPHGQGLIDIAQFPVVGDSQE